MICDEAMLPDYMLRERPISAARPDGAFRDEFKEGDKNFEERTFPILYLGTANL